MARARVLDVGNCDPDHGAIRGMLVNHFDVDVDRVMFVEEALAALGRAQYDLALVNRRIFADESDGMALVRAMRGNPDQKTPVMLVSNFPEAQASAVAAGALPGFGKAALRDARTIERLSQVLPERPFDVSTTAVQRFYRYHAYVYDFTRWTILHGRKRAVERLGLRPDSRVLEIGCGTGLNFRYLVERLDPQRGRLLGLDFSADMLRQAEKRVAAHEWPNVELLQGDATSMQLNRRFDAVLFAYSLTMIPDWPKAIERAVEHLKPGGRLVVLDFSTFDGWGPLRAAMLGWLRANHVETRRPYIATLKAALPNLEVTQWGGGYNFTAAGTKAV